MRQDITTHTSRATSPPAPQKRGRLDQQAARLVGAAALKSCVARCWIRFVYWLEILPSAVFQPGVRVGRSTPPPGPRRPGRDDLVLDGLQGLPVLALEDPFDLAHGAAHQLRTWLWKTQRRTSTRWANCCHDCSLQASRGPGERELGVLLGHQLRRVPHRDQRQRPRGEVAVVDLDKFLEGVDLVADDRGADRSRACWRRCRWGGSTWSPALQASHRGDDRVHPVADPGARSRPLTGWTSFATATSVRLRCRSRATGNRAARPSRRPTGCAPVAARASPRCPWRPSTGSAPSVRAVAAPPRRSCVVVIAHMAARVTLGHQRQQDEGRDVRSRDVPGTGPWRHRRRGANQP